MQQFDDYTPTAAIPPILYCSLPDDVESVQATIMRYDSPISFPTIYSCKLYKSASTGAVALHSAASIIEDDLRRLSKPCAEYCIAFQSYGSSQNIFVLCPYDVAPSILMSRFLTSLTSQFAYMDSVLSACSCESQNTVSLSVMLVSDNDVAHASYTFPEGYFDSEISLPVAQAVSLVEIPQGFRPAAIALSRGLCRKVWYIRSGAPDISVKFINAYGATEIVYLKAQVSAELKSECKQAVTAGRLVSYDISAYTEYEVETAQLSEEEDRALREAYVSKSIKIAYRHLSGEAVFTEISAKASNTPSERLTHKFKFRFSGPSVPTENPFISEAADGPFSAQYTPEYL